MLKEGIRDTFDWISTEVEEFEEREGTQRLWNGSDVVS